MTPWINAIREALDNGYNDPFSIGEFLEEEGWIAPQEVPDGYTLVVMSDDTLQAMAEINRGEYGDHAKGPGGARGLMLRWCREIVERNLESES